MIALPRPWTALDDVDLRQREPNHRKMHHLDRGDLDRGDLNQRDPLPPDVAVTRTARAYCGVAHGFTWQVTADRRPPPLVHLGAMRCTYRLAVNPTSRRPARDHLGNYVYVPGR